MGQVSNIEWTESTWNPIRGCRRVSPGCEKCYAERVAHRFGQKPGEPYFGLTVVDQYGDPRWNGKIEVIEKHMLDPLRWEKPRLIFANSMSDLFFEGLSVVDIDRIFAVMGLARRHTFQILTKRSKRMRDYWNDPATPGRVREAMDVLLNVYPKLVLKAHGKSGPQAWPFKNIWMGVSVEDQRRADERIPDLLATSAMIKWISAEPLLGRVDFTDYLVHPAICEFCYERAYTDVQRFEWDITMQSYVCPSCKARVHADGGYNVVKGGSYADGPDPRPLKRPFIDWIVVGGESGYDARPMHPQWARDIRDQCKQAGTAFFFKQWGEWFPQDVYAANKPIHVSIDGKRHQFVAPDRQRMARLSKKSAGRLLDGVEYSEYPEVD